MKKFTIFSVIMAVISLAVFVELYSNGYIGTNNIAFDQPADTLSTQTEYDFSTSGQASVLGAKQKENTPKYQSFSMGASIPTDLDNQPDALLSADTFKNTSSRLNLSTDENQNEPRTLKPFKTPVDFEDEGFNLRKTVYITNDHIKKAGFKDSFIVPIEHNGKLFKSITFSNIPGVSAEKFVIQSANEMFAMVYIFKIDQSIPVDSIYQSFMEKLKNFAGGSDSNINIYGNFGEGSFYFNDPKRPNVAFLTFKIKGSIYAFSYPKQNHPQILNLITLLSLEF